MTEEKPNVKTTLTKDDAAGWYLAENDSGTGEFGCVYWDGEKTYLSHDPNHKGYRWSVGWTNFRRLVEAPEPAGLDGISSKTFRIEHNPNCVKPFLVRFPGKGKGMIHGDQRDAIGCGATIIEAINAAEDPYRKITPEPVTNEAAREFVPVMLPLPKWEPDGDDAITWSYTRQSASLYCRYWISLKNFKCYQTTDNGQSWPISSAVIVKSLNEAKAICWDHYLGELGAKASEIFGQVPELPPEVIAITTNWPATNKPG